MLKNVETAEPLKFLPMEQKKKKLVFLKDVGHSYGKRCVLQGMNLCIEQGDRIALAGQNGSGKTTLMNIVSRKIQPDSGEVGFCSGLVVSCVAQMADGLGGSLRAYAQAEGVDESLMLALLRKLNFDREVFLQDIETFSAGQKKKICLAASLAKPAHLYVWDEPLNYIDVMSREQIEQAILLSRPTLLFVEHDALFCQRVANKKIELSGKTL